MKGYKSDTSERTFTQAFFAEDKAICERVQSGMNAQLGMGGKLVDMERVVVDFHNYIANRIGEYETTELFENSEAATIFLNE